MKRADKISGLYCETVNRLVNGLTGPDRSGTLIPEEIDELWEKISDELDITEVWTKISSDLDMLMPPDSGPGYFMKGCAAALIIMAGLIPVKKAMPDARLSEPPAVVETRNNDTLPLSVLKAAHAGQGLVHAPAEAISQLPEDLKITVTNETRTPGEDISPMEFPGEKTVYMTNRSVPGMVHVAETSGTDLLTPSGKPPGLELNIPSAPFSDGTLLSKVLYNADNENLKTGDHSFADMSSPTFPGGGRISAGVILLFKNTWLLNHETFDGLRPESLTTTEIVFYPDAGLSMNYSLSTKWSLRADGFFCSNTGQEYHEYEYGNYLRKKIILRYSTVSLSARYEILKGRNFMRRSSMNIMAGAYISYLTRAGQEKGTKYENIASGIKKTDAGIRLGYELEISLTDHFSLAPGLFVSVGIPDIYKGTGIVPGDLRRTNNGCEGFHLSIYYRYD